MLGVKSTSQDRWRQVLTEADETKTTDGAARERTECRAAPKQAGRWGQEDQNRFASIFLPAFALVGFFSAFIGFRRDKCG
jgi:hypothetical protein